MKKESKKTTKESKWWIEGLLWGVFMYVFMALYPFVFGNCITKKELLINIPIWIIGGLIFGLCLKRSKEKRKNEEE
jgi:hypothetical protein